MEEDPLAPGTFKHYRSPTMARDTLAGKIKPTVLSPADEAWVVWLNKEWRLAHGGKDIVTGTPQSIARTPIVVAMWQSRAVALGCWPVAGPGCTWQRLRALARHSAGWDLLGRAYRLLEEQRKLRGNAARYGIVVLSDGRDPNSTELSLAVLRAMLQPSETDPTGIQIHTVGIGTDAGEAVLTTIAKSAHGKYWKARTTSVTEVESIYREIVKYY